MLFSPLLGIHSSPWNSASSLFRRREIDTVACLTTRNVDKHTTPAEHMPYILFLKHVSSILRLCWDVLLVSTLFLSVYVRRVASRSSCSVLKYWLENEEQEV